MTSLKMSFMKSSRPTLGFPGFWEIMSRSLIASVSYVISNDKNTSTRDRVVLYIYLCILHSSVNRLTSNNQVLCCIVYISGSKLTIMNDHQAIRSCLCYISPDVGQQ